MIFRIRIILDVKEDVFRDLEIEASATLEEFHNTITQAFGFLGNEMASFYRTNDDWEQGEELPLMELDPSQPSMQNEVLEKLFTADNHKLLYIYDFLSMWTFFVELMEVAEPVAGIAYPTLIYAEGEVPEEAPEKIIRRAARGWGIFRGRGGWNCRRL
ncbi:plasmid pRiA4b ORF-3 family protein [Flavobacteriaceae bacterium]|nr:plasmid pRiA4b ORF-3 family protein [Flavobacteriaceae bacterium]